MLMICGIAFHLSRSALPGRVGITSEDAARLRRCKIILTSTVLFVAIAFLIFLGVWYFASSSSLAEQRRYEQLLLGKDRDQVEAILESKARMYVTRKQVIADHGECHWPVAENAIGHWYEGRLEEGDVVCVVFDEAGRVARIAVKSGFSIKLRRWLSFSN
jgi:hypothetical protein